MKKLYCIITLFVAFAVQAQNITEKDLLGTWNLTTATMRGVCLDFEKETVTRLEGYEDFFSPADLKKLENGIKGQHPFPTSVRFIEGSKMETVSATGSFTKDYALNYKQGATFLNDDIDQFELRIANGLLHLVFQEEEGSIIMTFKKQ